ncbi:glutamine amidotransferase [Aggregicoccus sp. 17bor-14]|uniref:glutamine amidotransferase-related protein n=1 Tax=Myxococcaceae TaxID=31 RepID=UPI00129CFB4B|nr:MULTISPECIES: glutamine amidotransferase [Myxococcaceae]MBF5042421.1 glutamine amidotransferase [Simulacricoccus sp. 17bor-14]MRI88193.1 glutamine amidotransferase [Aggregicoccus sp. 17bor-14]
MRAVVYQHAEHEGLGLLGPALQRAGFEVVTRMRQVRHHEDAEAPLLVVLGGPMGVYEADQHPFLHQERAVLAERLGAGRPNLGICLGAQLLAAAAGSEVSRGKNGLEVGVAPVRWTKDGLADPVLAPAAPRSTVAHWHSDTWAPVPGAALLASTDRYAQQGFRLGPSYGLQFHLELGAEAFDHWLSLGEGELQAAGRELAPLRKDLGKLRAAEAENTALLTRLAEHFAHAAR